MVKPKKSMANGYVIEEALGFCTKYIQGNEIHEEGMGWRGAYYEWWKEGNGHPLSLSAILKSSHTCPPQCINDQPWCEWDFFMALKYVLRS